MKFAWKFLQNKATFLADLNDKGKSILRLSVTLSSASCCITNADEVRSRLEAVVTTLPYDWYGDPVVQREVEKFAQARYNQGGSDKVLDKIEKMDADKSKEYLKRLIKENMNV